MLSPRNGYPRPEFGFWALGIIISDAALRQRLLTPHRRRATGYRKLRSVLREAQGREIERRRRDSGLPAREDNDARSVEDRRLVCLEETPKELEGPLNL